MPADHGASVSSKTAQFVQTARGERQFLRLLRDSHIFASAIREILDVKLLREVSPSPLTPSQFQLLKLMSLNGQHQVGEVANKRGGLA